MGERLNWIEYEGFKILIVDFSGIKDEGEYLKAFDAMEEEVIRQGRGKGAPAVVDVTDTVLSPAVTERAKAMMAAAKEAGVPDSPTAMVGLSGFQKAVVQALQFFRRDLYVASSVQEAKDWLVKQLRG